MTKREVMQMALDALLIEKDVPAYGGKRHLDPAINALRAELAKPEPEPVAWTYETALSKISFDNGSSSYIWKNSHASDMTPLYRKEDL